MAIIKRETIQIMILNTFDKIIYYFSRSFDHYLEIFLKQNSKYKKIDNMQI